MAPCHPLGFTRRSWLAAAAMVATGARADLADVVASSKPSIVAVGTYAEIDNPRFSFRGTGFVVGDGNKVVTNLHVLPSALDAVPKSTLMVQLRRSDGSLEPRSARLVDSDPVHDLALLAIDGAPAPALRLGDVALVREGTSVAFIGFPIGGILGFSPVTHRGIVSSVTRIALPAANAEQLSARALAQLREGAFDVYQLDATAYPGNSGGPVLDVSSGQVVGVINMVLVRGTRESALTHPTGISYAIPVAHVRALLSGR